SELSGVFSWLGAAGAAAGCLAGAGAGARCRRAPERPLGGGAVTTTRGSSVLWLGCAVSAALGVAARSASSIAVDLVRVRNSFMRPRSRPPLDGDMPPPPANTRHSDSSCVTALRPRRRVSPASPPERSGELIGTRRAEIELILIAWIGPSRVDGVGDVAHAECQANVLEVRRSEVAAGNIHERKDIANRVGLHPGEVVLEQEAATDMAHRAADFDRPARPSGPEPI